MAAFFVVVAEIEQMQGWKCGYWLCDKQLKEMRDAEREREDRKLIVKCRYWLMLNAQLKEI